MDRAVPYLLVGLLAIALVVVVAAVAIQGVSDLTEGNGFSPEPAVGGWEPPAGADPAFVYSSPARVVMPPPSHLTAPLPRTANELRDVGHQGPPAGVVRGRLAVGHGPTQDELLSALRSADATGATEEELGAAFDHLIGGIGAPEHCAWLRDVIDQHPDVPLRRSFWDALLWCDDPATATFLERDDVPAGTLVTWWEAHHLDAGPVPVEALADAILEAARRGHAGSALRGAQVLARMTPRALEELADRIRRLPRNDARRSLSTLVASVPGEPSAPELDQVVRDSSMSLDMLVATTDQPERVARALVRCAVPTSQEADAEPVDEARAAECLRALARTDAAMAVQAARALRRWGMELPYLRETAHALLDVGDHQAMRWRLSKHWDLSSAASAAPPPGLHGLHGLGVAARDVLREEGHARCFPTDAGSRPVAYPELLQQLAHLAPALQDVTFDHTPPRASVHDYTLDAFLDGERFSIYAYDLGSTYDVPVVLGFLNALARARQTDHRYALLAPPRPDTTCVVAGPEESLLALEREGLLTLAEP